jgi:hypothetical protein
MTTIENSKKTEQQANNYLAHKAGRQGICRLFFETTVLFLRLP